MQDLEQLLGNQSDTIRSLQRERDAALTVAAAQTRRAERAEAQLSKARAEHLAQLHGDWTDANPAVRELREMELGDLGLALIVRDGQGWIARPGAETTKLSLCAWSPDEVLAWVDGYETAHPVAAERAEAERGGG